MEYVVHIRIKVSADDISQVLPRLAEDLAISELPEKIREIAMRNLSASVEGISKIW